MTDPDPATDPAPDHLGRTATVRTAGAAPAARRAAETRLDLRLTVLHIGYSILELFLPCIRIKDIKVFPGFFADINCKDLHTFKILDRIVVHFNEITSQSVTKIIMV